MNQKHAIKEQSRDHEKKSKDVNTKLATEFTYTCTIATEFFLLAFRQNVKPTHALDWPTESHVSSTIELNIRLHAAGRTSSSEMNL